MRQQDNNGFRYYATLVTQIKDNFPSAPLALAGIERIARRVEEDKNMTEQERTEIAEFLERNRQMLRKKL